MADVFGPADLVAENQLGKTTPFATPEQVREARAYAAALQFGHGQQPVKHWTQGVSNMVASLIGGYKSAQTANQELGSLSSVGRAQASNPDVPTDKGGSAPVFPTASAPHAELPPGYNPDDPTYNKVVAKIESGGNPRNVTGSNRGLMQFGPEEERRYGITNWQDPDQQSAALAKERADHHARLVKALGRAPTPSELYLTHQQGPAGGPAILGGDPNEPAWKAIRPYYNSDRMAQLAITGNIPSDSPLKQVPVDRITKGTFAALWDAKYNRFAAREGGTNAPKGYDAVTSMARLPGESDRDYAGRRSDAFGQLQADTAAREGATSPSAGSALAFNGRPADDPQNAPDAPSAIARALAPRGAGGAAPAAAPVPGAAPRQVAPVGQEGANPIVGPNFIPSRAGMTRQQFEFLMGPGGAWLKPEEKAKIQEQYYGQGKAIQMPIEGVGTVLVDPKDPTKQQMILTPHNKKLEIGDIKVEKGYVRKPDGHGGYIDVPIQQQGGNDQLRAPGTGNAPAGKPPPSLDEIPNLMKHGPDETAPVPDQTDVPPGLRGVVPGEEAPAQKQSMLGTPPPAFASADEGRVVSDAAPIGGPGDKLAMADPQADPNAPVPAARELSPDAQAQLTQEEQNLVDWNDQRKRLNEANQKFDAKDVESFDKKYETMQVSGLKAAEARPQLEMARDIVYGNKMIQGALADPRLALAKLAELAKIDPQAAAATEIFNKIISGNVLNDMKIILQGLGQVRVAEIDLLSKATANMYNTKEANKAVIDIMLRTHKQAEVLAEAGNAYRQGWRYDEKGKPYMTGERPTSAGYDETIQRVLKKMPVYTPEERHKYAQIFEKDPAYNKERSAMLEKQYTAWAEGKGETPPPGSAAAPAAAPAAPATPTLSPLEQERARRNQRQQ